MIKVSDLFVDIFQNINVVTQIERMRELERKELLLLLTLSIAMIDTSLVFVENVRPFKDECFVIRDSLPQNRGKVDVTDIDIIKLIEESSGDDLNSIDPNEIRDQLGNKLPKLLSNEEALIRGRELRIDNIIK